MPIDPVRNIQHHDVETALDIHTLDPLRLLAALPASLEIPYLTVTADWTPSGSDPGRLPAPELRRSEHRNRTDPESTSRRPGRTWVTSELRALLGSLEPRSEQHAHLERSLQRIEQWVDTELDPAASGIYIVAGPDVFISLALGVTIANSVHFGPLPVLDGLAHVTEDFATYAVLVADQENAEISLLTQGTRDQTIDLTSTLYPRRQRQGGPNERRYKARADQRATQFAKAIVEQLDLARREETFDVLVLVGSRVFLDEIENQFSADLTNCVAGTVPMDLKPWPSAQAIADATREIDLAAEREREAQAVAEVLELAGQQQAMLGPEAVLNALQAHQVRKLVMNEDFEARGWADLSLPVYGLGDIPAEHPAGGDVADLRQVDLTDEFVRLTLQTDGDIEFVHVQAPMASEGVPTTGSELPRTQAATDLDAVGGVGVLLRYAV